VTGAAYFRWGCLRAQLTYTSSPQSGVYIGIAETAQRAAVPKYVAGHLRDAANGVYNMVTGFSFLAANLVFVFLLDSSGIAVTATYSIVMSVIAIAALIGFQAVTRVRAA
jgi:hypothetical protein